MITVIIGFLLGNFAQEFLEIKMFQISVEIQSIGHIIPGLIANWMERQGIIPTLWYYAYYRRYRSTSTNHTYRR
jgi:hypothetical protein